MKMVNKKKGKNTNQIKRHTIAQWHFTRIELHFTRTKLHCTQLHNGISRGPNYTAQDWHFIHEDQITLHSIAQWHFIHEDQITLHSIAQ